MIGNDFLCIFKKDYEEKKFLRVGTFKMCWSLMTEYPCNPLSVVWPGLLSPARLQPGQSERWHLYTYNPPIYGAQQAGKYGWQGAQATSIASRPFQPSLAGHQDTELLLLTVLCLAMQAKRTFHTFVDSFPPKIKWPATQARLDLKSGMQCGSVAVWQCGSVVVWQCGTSGEI